MGRIRSVALATAMVAAAVVTTYPAAAQVAPEPTSSDSATPAEVVPGPDQPAPGASSFDPATSVPDDNQTTPNRRVWRNRNGTSTIELTSAPTRFKNASGEWTDYDLSPMVTSESRIAAKNSDVGIELPGSADAAASIPTRAGELRLSHPGATNAAAFLTGRSVRYRGALGGRDLVHELTVTGLKETVVVPATTTGGSYRDTFTLPTAVNARNGGAGVEFVDKAGKVVADFGGGDAWESDSADGIAGAHTAVATKLLSQQGRVATVEVSISSSWLKTPSRAMTVTIDPMLTLYSNSSGSAPIEDTYVVSNQGATPITPQPIDLYAGVSPTKARALVRFPSLVGTTSNAVVTAAWVRAYNFYSQTTAGRQIAVYGITAPWSHTAVWPGPYVDSTYQDWQWLNYGNGSCCAGQWVTWQIPSLAQRWMTNPTTTYYGVEFKSLSESSPSDYPSMRGIHGGLSGSNSAPVLHIDYYVRPNAADQLTPANNAKVPTAPTLSARYVQTQSPYPSVNGNVAFAVYDQNNPANQGACTSHTCVAAASGNGNNNVNVPSGTTVSWTPPTLPDSNYLYTATSISADGYTALSAPLNSFMIDSVTPYAPYSAMSTSHTAGFAMSDRTVDTIWTDGADDASGIAGYSWAFTSSASDVADVSIDSTGLSATSPSLSDGTWWFHVRTIDAAGNGSDDTSYGPIVISGAAITLPILPPFSRADNRCIGDSSYNDPIHCDAPADPDNPLVVGPDDYRHLYGYDGPYYSPVSAGSGVQVLTQTVSTTTTGNWRAFGLVRNEANTTSSSVVVSAALFDANNVALDLVSSPLAIPALRSHEPGPFSLSSSSIPAANVHHVVWSVSFGAGLDSNRTLLLEDKGALRYGARDPLMNDLALGTESGLEPYPFVQRGTISNDGTTTVNNPTIVGAWLDANGRVIWVATTPLLVRSGQPLGQMAPGTGGIYGFSISDPDVAPLLFNSTFISWGIGS